MLDKKPIQLLLSKSQLQLRLRDEYHKKEPFTEQNIYIQIPCLLKATFLPSSDINQVCNVLFLLNIIIWHKTCN